MPYLSWKSFDYKGDAFSLFEAIKDRANPFFLDSSLRKYGLGRYSFLGCEPFYVFKGEGKAALGAKPEGYACLPARQGAASNRPQGHGAASNSRSHKESIGRAAKIAESDFLEGLRRLLERYTLKIPKTGFPFFGGAVGYFSYDWGLSLEGIESRKKDDLFLPEVFLGVYDVVIAIDHWKKKLFVFSSGFPERSGLAAKKRSGERLKQVVGLLPGIPKDKRRISVGRPRGAAPTANFTKEEYLKAVNKAKEYIRKGDIYQVNLSQRFLAQSRISPDELYASLRRESPGGFSAYLDHGDFQILSSSPERFLCFDGKKVWTRPMKGTRPRGRDSQSDKRNKENLLKSPKDKAELLMIADLMRNDLGRVCEYGSVKVRSLRNLEAYSTVYQTTATVEGVLHKDRDRIDLLKACFPGGSITGCPKIRAMQIIDELEPTRRGTYTGALGYLGFNGGMDLNILIRTILKKGDKIYFQTGGGIVADSRAESEYQETLVKAKGMMKAIGAG